MNFKMKIEYKLVIKVTQWNDPVESITYFFDEYPSEELIWDKIQLNVEPNNYLDVEAKVEKIYTREIVKDADLQL